MNVSHWVKVGGSICEKTKPVSRGAGKVVTYSVTLTFSRPESNIDDLSISVTLWNLDERGVPLRNWDLDNVQKMISLSVHEKYCVRYRSFHVTRASWACDTRLRTLPVDDSSEIGIYTQWHQLGLPWRTGNHWQVLGLSPASQLASIACGWPR